MQSRKAKYQCRNMRLRPVALIRNKVSESQYPMRNTLQYLDVIVCCRASSVFHRDSPKLSASLAWILR